MKEGVNLTVFYNIDSKAENVDRKWILNGCMIAFARKKDIPDPQLFFCHLVKDGYATNYFATDHILEGTAAPTHVQYLVGLILFSNFCEVETKIVPPGKKSLYRNDKYVNETGLPIEILDSTWFTTIVRSEGFSVGGDTGGFFRWQRFGPNLSQKKIIWVTAFEKKGYMRKAKVLMTRQ